MSEAFKQLVGKGIYSVPEASRLVGVPSQTIRRWLEGYSYKYKDQVRETNAFVRHDLPKYGDQLVITFQELIEVRFVYRFRNYGVSWPTIRLASARAAEIFNTKHPFTSLRFRTDGRAIFAEVGEEAGEEKLLELARSQWAISQVIKPSLYKELEYSMSKTEELLRWWPLGKNRNVVLDPKRAFGQPITSKEGVPTEILFLAFQKNDSIDAVSNLYEVSKSSVRDAVTFEKKKVH